jgi:hypothetical protein
MENTLQGDIAVRRRVRGDAAALAADATLALKQKPCFAGRCKILVFGRSPGGSCRLQGREWCLLGKCKEEAASGKPLFIC